MTNGGKSINTNSIQLTPTAGTAALTGATYTAINLSVEDKVLVASTTGGVDKKISVAYKGAGAQAYLDNYIAGQTPTVYTTELTYTIVSK